MSTLILRKSFSENDLRHVARTSSEVSSTETARVVSGNENANASNQSPVYGDDIACVPAGGEVETKSSSEPIVPDGGWGWMVAFCSFMVQSILSFGFSFGVFVDAFVNYFESSKSEVGGLGSLTVGMTGIAGKCYLKYYLWYM